jgi:hypothetical protein
MPARTAKKRLPIYTLAQLEAMTADQRRDLEPEQVPKELDRETRARLFTPYPVSGLMPMKTAANYVGLSRMGFWDNLWKNRIPPCDEKIHDLMLWRPETLDQYTPALRGWAVVHAKRNAERAEREAELPEPTS